MFNQLSERLQSTLSDVRSRGKLTESDVDSAMREIRLALLEADVNFKVVKSFTKTLKARCLGSEVLVTMGKRAGAHGYERGTEADPVDIATWALDEARAERRDVLIVDTAGRLHIDQDLMA